MLWAVVGGRSAVQLRGENPFARVFHCVANAPLLQFIIARRVWNDPGKGVMFVTPLQGDREIAAAAQVGFNVTHTLHSVRAVGRDRPGVAAELTQRLADASINLRGFSVAVIGTQFIAYIAVDSLQDAKQAIEILELG